MGRTRRCFTLDHDVSRRIDHASPRGERSEYVNQLLKRALVQDQAAVLTIFSLNMVVVSCAVVLGLAVL